MDHLKIRNSGLSKKHLLIFGIIFALIGSYLVLKSFAASGVTANIWVDLNGGSCSRSVTATEYTDSAACSNLTTALAAAQNNDLILVKGGNYSGGANLELNNSITTQVTIKEAPGEITHFGTLGNKNPSVSAPKNVLIDGIDFAHIDFAYKNGVRLTNFTVENTKLDSGGGVFVHSSLGLTLKNIEVGSKCCSSDGMVLNADVPNGEPQNENVTIDGMYMHDIARLCAAYPLSNCPGDNTAAHVDCIQVYGIKGTLTIKNSRFYNCATQGIFFSAAVGGSFADSTLSLENVAVGQVYEPGTAINLGSADANLTISYLSVAGSLNIRSPSAGHTALVRSSLGRISGNLCLSGVVYQNNVWTNAKCSASDIKVSDAGFVSTSVLNPDLHIQASSPAIDQAGSTYCPLADFEGTARPQGPSCDAGADEYSSGGGGTAPKTGDINTDGSVNILDLSILLSKWGTTDSASDLNKDGSVNILDLSILLSNYGT